MPLGFELTTTLIAQLQENSGAPLRNLLDEHYGRTEVTAFQRALRYSESTSVDAFLECRPEFKRVGKAAIAGYLLPLEIQENLFPNRMTWYRYLLERLPSFDQFSNNRLVVITFNYDRTLEKYLITALSERWNTSQKEVTTKLASGLPIVHVYGSLGKLTTEELRDGETPVPFGASPSQKATLERAAEAIRLMGDRDETSTLKAANDLLRNSNRIIFLGFGYNATNLARIFQYPPLPLQQLVGSGIGLKRKEAELVGNILANRKSNSVVIDCEDDRDDSLLTYLRRRCWLDN